MKKAMFIFVFGFFSLAFCISVSAKPREGYQTFASAEFEHLSIISFSIKWDEKSLEALYDELKNNFTSTEFEYLKAIYLYPDSPEGVLGYYYEDISLSSDLNIVFGKEAFIELFNADRKTTVTSMAATLSHEYGHHYTLFNITNYEKKYSTAWDKSEYASIRFKNNEPVAYFVLDGTSNSYDVCEIVASDYVQLLGSKLAKLSYDYMDAEEKLAANDDEVSYIKKFFNSRPQENIEIPLAADVTGLYEYMLRVGGYYDKDAKSKLITTRPSIIEIVSVDDFIDKKHTLTWLPAENYNNSFEYTLIMFPADFPFMVSGVKTVNTGEELKAVFGTASVETDTGTIRAILDSYSGLYCFRIYAKDDSDFIYSSEDFFYEFGEEEPEVWEPAPSSKPTETETTAAPSETAAPTKTTPPATAAPSNTKAPSTASPKPVNPLDFNNDYAVAAKENSYSLKGKNYGWRFGKGGSGKTDVGFVHPQLVKAESPIMTYFKHQESLPSDDFRIKGYFVRTLLVDVINNLQKNRPITLLITEQVPKIYKADKNRRNS